MVSKLLQHGGCIMLHDADSLQIRGAYASRTWQNSTAEVYRHGNEVVRCLCHGMA